MKRITLLLMMVWGVTRVLGQTAISSNEDLLGMVANGNYYLTADLELEGWVPMTDFTGTLDGRGHIIVLTDGQLDGNGSAGLFSNTHGAIIKNLIIGGKFLGIRAGSGSIAAHAYNTTFLNCETEAILVTSDKTALLGGLVGVMDGGLMVNCSTRGVLEGYLMGGLAGSTLNGATIKNCYSYTTFISRTLDNNSQIGGLVHDHAGDMENCYVAMGRDGWYVPSISQLNQMHGLRGFFMTRYGRIIGWAEQYTISSSFSNTKMILCLDEYANIYPFETSSFLDHQGKPIKFAHEFYGSGYNIGDVVYVCGLPTIVFNINDNGLGGNLVTTGHDLNQYYVVRGNGNQLSDYFRNYIIRFEEHEYAISQDGVTAYGQTTPVIPEAFRHNLGKFFTYTLRDYEDDPRCKIHDFQTYSLLGKHASLKQLAYTSTGRVSACYYPYERNQIALISNSLEESSARYYTVSTPYSHGKFGPKLYRGSTLTEEALVDTLNAWVKLQNNDLYAPWAIANTTFLNYNMPIHGYGFFNGETDVNSCIERGWRFQHKALRYADINHLNAEQTIFGNTLAYYDHLDNIHADNITHPWESPLYITEHASLKGNFNLKGNVCITLDNTDASGFAGANYDWHCLGSTLSDAPIGINYNGYIAGGLNGNPSQVAVNNANAYLPVGISYNDWDLYCYNEPHDGWTNFKRKTGDHYNHWTGEHINYTNETVMQPGKGYLAAVTKKTGLQGFGTLNNNDISITLSKKSLRYPGYNLLGNPYHAYLDFNAFCDDNEDVMTQRAYAILDADRQGYICYCPEASDNPVYAPRYLHPHQGFFIQTHTDGSQAIFKTSQTVATPDSYFRKHPENYPLINLSVTDDEGRKDYATAELDRPRAGGMTKLQGLKSGKAELSISHQQEEYSIAFLPERPTSIPVHFQADADGTYTLEWEVRNDQLPCLFLLDNITGRKVNCLTENHYSFHARHDDYPSRFKLLLSDTAADEENDPDEPDTNEFAYLSDHHLTVKGQGQLALYDLQGRKLWTESATQPLNRLPLPPLAKGVYLLQLSNPHGTRTQKIMLQ